MKRFGISAVAMLMVLPLLPSAVAAEGARIVGSRDLPVTLRDASTNQTSDRPAGQVPFPLEVLEQQGDELRVRIGGADYWVDQRLVEVEGDVGSSESPDQRKVAESNGPGGTRGLGGD